MLAVTALTLVTLVVLALLITSTREFLQRKELAHDLSMVRGVDEGEELLRQIQADIELFRRAYQNTFRVDSKVDTQELFAIKRRVVDNLNLASRRLPNDVDAERALLHQIESIDDELGDKLCDVVERRREGFWLAPLDSYFMRKQQRGKLDVFGRGKSSTITRAEGDRMALPDIRPINFEVHE